MVVQKLSGHSVVTGINLQNVSFSGTQAVQNIQAALHQAKNTADVDVSGLPQGYNIGMVSSYDFCF